MSFSRAWAKSPKLDPFKTPTSNNSSNLHGGSATNNGTEGGERRGSFSNSSLMSSTNYSHNFPLVSQAATEYMYLSAVEDGSSSSSGSSDEGSDYIDPTWVVDENEQEERRLWREKQEIHMKKLKMQEDKRKRKLLVHAAKVAATSGQEALDGLDAESQIKALKRLRELDAERDVEDFQSAVSKLSTSDSFVRLLSTSGERPTPIIASLRAPTNNAGSAQPNRLHNSKEDNDKGKEKQHPKPHAGGQEEINRQQMLKRQTTPVPPLALNELRPEEEEDDEGHVVPNKIVRRKRKHSIKSGRRVGGVQGGGGGGRVGRERLRGSEVAQRRGLYEKRMQDLNEWYVRRRREIEMEFQDILHTTSHDEELSSSDSDFEEGRGEDESAATTSTCAASSSSDNRNNNNKKETEKMTRTGKLLKVKSTSFRDMMNEMKRQKQMKAEKKNEQQTRGRQREKPSGSNNTNNTSTTNNNGSHHEKKPSTGKRGTSKEKEKEKEKEKDKPRDSPRVKVHRKRDSIVFEETDDSLSKKNPYVDIFRSHSLSPPRNKGNNLIKSKLQSRSNRNNKQQQQQQQNVVAAKKYDHKPMTRSSSKRLPIPTFTTDYEASAEDSAAENSKITGDDAFWAERQRVRRATSTPAEQLRPSGSKKAHMSSPPVEGDPYPYPPEFGQHSASSHFYHSGESSSSNEDGQKDKIRSSSRKLSSQGSFFGLMEQDSSPRDRNEHTKVCPIFIFILPLTLFL